MNTIIEDISSFGSESHVKPSEDQLITLTIGQLQDLVAQAIQPLQDEVRDLKDIVASLEGKFSALESAQEQDVNRLALDIAFDRQRLSNLEQKEPQPLQRDRGEILRALLAANSGKMLATEARKKMHLSRQTFSELLSRVKDDIEAKPYHRGLRGVGVAETPVFRPERSVPHP